MSFAMYSYLFDDARDFLLSGIVQKMADFSRHNFMNGDEDAA